MSNIEESYTEEEDVIINLELEDGTQMECVVLARFPLEDRQYVALLPTDQLDDEEGEVFLYRFSEDEDGEVILDNIQDDEEFEAVADRYDEILDELDYDELVDASELDEE
ncbi:MAG: DUF1292 domain-containing protein [Lachnospiraceae bacterium]|nr:DUF1292 domain-containing protein [Lachnospiraceae bacterium]